MYLLPPLCGRKDSHRQWDLRVQMMEAKEEGGGAGRQEPQRLEWMST